MQTKFDFMTHKELLIAMQHALVCNKEADYKELLQEAANRIEQSDCFHKQMAG